MKGLMKRFLVVVLALACASAQFVFSQTLPSPASMDEMGIQMLRQTDRHRKQYEWFHEQRGMIPPGAREWALKYRDQMKATIQRALEDTSRWFSIGPWPGSMGSYGDISGRVCAIAIDPEHPDTVYIGAAEGGVWKTTDAGVHWKPLTDDQPTLACGALAIDPSNTNIIYWGTGEQNGCGSLCYLGVGIMKSTDGGSTWSKTGLQTPSSATFAIIVDPINTNIVYAAMHNGVFRSTNAGVTWTNLLSGRATDLVMDPTSTSTLYAAIGGVGLFKTTNSGSTWVQDTSGLPPAAQINRMSLGLCASTPTTLYAGIYGSRAPGGLASDTNRVFKSTDGGNTWKVLPKAPNYGGGQGWYNNIVAVEPTNSDVVYVGGIDLWRSTDGGANWTNLTRGYQGGPVHVDQHAIAFHPKNPKAFYLGNDGGMYKSSNRGTTWINLNQDLVTVQFYTIGVDWNSGLVTYGGTQDNGAQRRISNLRWQDVTGGDAGYVLVDYSNSNIVYSEWQNGYHLKSTDGGFHFFPIMNGIPVGETGNWITPVAMDPQNPQVLYTGTTKFYKTVNGGVNWTTTGIVVDQMTSPRKLSAIAVSPSNTQVIYVAVGDHGVYRSFTGGLKWLNVTDGLPQQWVTRILVHPESSAVAYVTLSGYSSPHVFKTTNNGSNWINISSNLPSVPVNAIVMDPVDRNTLYIGTDIGVFRTTNGGVSWAPFMNGLPNVVVNDLSFTKTGALRAATAGRGMWQYSPLNRIVLAVSAIPANGGTVTPSGIMTVSRGQTLTLTATPSPGFMFTGWGGDTTTTVNPLQVVMWKDKVIVANFLSTSLPENEFYKTVNSDRGGVAFNWIELSTDASATKVKPSDWHNRKVIPDSIDDGTVGPLKLGFPFYFYGGTAKKENVYIGANGAISLSQDHLNYLGGDGIGYYTDDWTIPGVPIRDFISPFWNDLWLTPGKGHGDVYYKSDASNKKFIIEWYQAGNFNSPTDTATTFEIILDGNNNSILFQYLNVGTTGLDSTALIGVQKDSANGLLYYLGGKQRIPLALKVHNNLALLFNPKFVVSASERNTVPTEFALEQNYPNPFNPTTSIEFQVPRSEFMNLKVYDVLGREVVTLVDEKKEPGVYKVEFDGSKLASGVYFYRMQAGSFSRARKMIILR